MLFKDITYLVLDRLGFSLQRHIYSLLRQFQLYLLESSWKEIQVGTRQLYMYNMFCYVCHDFSVILSSCFRWKFDCSTNSCIDSTMWNHSFTCWRTAIAHTWSCRANSIDVYVYVQLCKGPKRFGS